MKDKQSSVVVASRLDTTHDSHSWKPLSLGSRVSLATLVQTLTVAEYLNFRHAANRLGVSQSSVSTRVKVLEENLGVLLFERRHRGVRLTEAGHLNIGMYSLIASGFLADLRRRYRSEHPNIELVIAEGRSTETIRQVREGTLDVAFVIGAVDAPDCHSRQVWSEAFVITLPADHPLTKAQSIAWIDLASETFLVRQGGSGPQVHDHIVRRINDLDRVPSIRRFDVGRDTLMHMVADGEGITLTNEATAHVPFPGVVFLPIADQMQRARFSAVWSPHNRSSALKNLLDLAADMSRSA